MATATTDEYWDVNGVILHRHGFNISTLTGRLAFPDIKGSDLSIPHRTGDEFRRKWAGGRTITLSMWVRGTKLDLDGTPYIDDETAYNENFAVLVRALYHIERQMVLTKRWKVRGPAILGASARCTYAGGLNPQHDGDRTLSKFSVDLRLQDPWFYGDEIRSDSIGRGHTKTLTNPGHVDATGHGVFVEFHGPLTNPRLLATRVNRPNVWVQYNEGIADGGVITLDVENFTATRADGSNVIQNVSRAGHRAWMPSWRGDTDYQLTADGGDGFAVVRMSPPYV